MGPTGPRKKKLRCSQNADKPPSLAYPSRRWMYQMVLWPCYFRRQTCPKHLLFDKGDFVGQFLKAAYEVLNSEKRPLSAKEITEIAVREGRLKSSGKTPPQTMKARLSTEILRRGSDSIFMRVEKGQFALREWKGRWKGGWTEHIAQRFKAALYDEDIVVFPAESSRSTFPIPDFTPGSLTPRHFCQSAVRCSDAKLKKTTP